MTDRGAIGASPQMHRLTRLKAKWQPTVTEIASVIFSADPRKLLAREADVLVFVFGRRPPSHRLSKFPTETVSIG